MARIPLLLILLVTITARAEVVDVAVPAPPGSSEPYLFADAKGGLLLSWIEEHEGGAALRVARYDGRAWSAPSTIRTGAGFFVNSSDIPSVMSDSRGTLFAQWLQKSGGSPYAHDVYYAVSTDGGKTWSAPARLNRDGKQAEHGFTSIVPLRGGGAGAVWLEGRDDHTTILRYAEIDRRGALSSAAVLDDRVCDCCATAMTTSASGAVVAYRDRSMDETRDISVVRAGRGGWTKPAPLHADGWHIKACPVNGPQLDARGNAVAAAWYTAAGDEARVFAALSRDGGKSFAAPVRVDAGAPVGRVDILAHAGGALVVWIEGTTIAARQVAPPGPVMTLGETSNVRAAGVPRAALVGDVAYVAWTEAATPKRVRIVSFRVR